MIAFCCLGNENWPLLGAFGLSYPFHAYFGDQSGFIVKEMSWNKNTWFPALAHQFCVNLKCMVFFGFDGSAKQGYWDIFLTMRAKKMIHV